MISCLESVFSEIGANRNKISNLSISIETEAKLQLKFRLHGLGDGFPSEDSIASFTDEDIAILNNISDAIDSYLGRKQRRYLRKTTYCSKPTTGSLTMKPILQSTDYQSSLVSTLPQTNYALPSFAPGFSPIKEKIMIYLERSTASALNIREKRQTLEDCCASKFSFFKIPSLPLPPVSYIKPTEVINKLIDLTNTVDHELYALETFFDEVSRLSRELNFNFLGDDTIQNIRWIKSNITTLKKLNMSLSHKTTQARGKDEVLLKIPAFKADTIEHNKKTELLVKELENYGHIFITELSSYFDLQELPKKRGCHSSAAVTTHYKL